MRPTRTGVDVGGTFTDVVAWDGGALSTGKVPSTPDQSDGVVEGIRTVAGDEPGEFVHGTTVATNALLERRGARTVLVTDVGFEDLIEIGRQDRPSLYDTSVTRSIPLVAREDRFGLRGRATQSDHGARVHEEDVDAIVAADPEAVAVCLLYGYRDGERERAARESIAARLPGTRISISSEVAAEFREYERTSTTVVNAYLRPEVARYLDRLTDRVASIGVTGSPMVMRSSGGLVPLDRAGSLPASILLSGPAGGVVAATALGSALGHDRIISFDMGGTSTDVCRIDDGRPDISYERTIDGFPVRMPSVAIHTVGAGGGSVGWIDEGGALRVGPRSAGAVPGPVAYGRGGTEPTVTDANLAVGRLAAGSKLGGTLDLDLDLARDALEALGGRVDLNGPETALGMIEIVEAHMERAIRTVSVEQGADPRRAVLVAFGGAGGLHATALARRLGMASVVVPAHAGVFSALGLLLAPPRADAALSMLLREGDAELDAAIGRIASSARSALDEVAEISTSVDIRYMGQSHETVVPYASGEGWTRLVDRFHDAHRAQNGFSRPGDPIEVVTVRAEAVGRPTLTWDTLPTIRPGGEPRRGHRRLRTPEGEMEAELWWRPALAPGTTMTGPAVIEEPEATTYLLPGDRAVVHPSGAIEVTW